MGYIVPNMGKLIQARRMASELPTSVADALFSKSRQRVLAVLFGNVGRSFYANEIIRLAACGTGAVQRELASLASAGLVLVTRVGNQKHFQANANAPVFASVRDLVLKTSGLADVLRSALAAVAPEIRAAFVYGSVARNEDSGASDVDLLVISDGLAYATLFAALEEAARRLGRPVNPTLYSGAEFAHRVRKQNAFVMRVLAQPKIWVIGSADDLTA
jgi:predicted nucleotidyltransferase